MQPQIRDYYNLEELWGAKRVNMKIDPEYALPNRSLRAKAAAAAAAGSNAEE